MKTRVIPIFFTILFLKLSSISFSQNQVLGKWLTQDKDAIVEIYKEKEYYYGKVVKLIPEKYEDGLPIIDENNPDKSLRKRPVLGINTIIKFDWSNDDKELINGKVYDPKTGKFYEGKVWEENGNLKMRGYVGFLYQTETWTRIK